SAGAPHSAEIVVEAISEENPFENKPKGNGIREKMLNLLKEPDVSSQKGLIEMFDSSIGASTVLMPFGGKNQLTETQVSVQTLPVGNHVTHTASIMSFGFNPVISTWSPYHGAAYAVVESIAKVVAAGGNYSGMRFSYQEYFEKMSSPKAWGKPLSALLGALRMQLEFGLPSIGGKDSMSGTFADISVPPTLIAFGITTIDTRKVISTEFKYEGENIYLLCHTPLSSGMPDSKALMGSYQKYNEAVERGEITSAYAPGARGIAEAVSKMSFGNSIGAIITIEENDLWKMNYGSIVFTSRKTAEELAIPDIEKIGVTTAEPGLSINGELMEISELIEANRNPFVSVYPDRSGVKGRVIEPEVKTSYTEYAGEKVEHPVVYLPSFPGTNCDYDMEKAFVREGGNVIRSVFRNLTADDVDTSVDEIARNIDNCHILALSGGFSAGDEPDGSGKFIASVLQNEKVKNAIEKLLARNGLILGICNGFQALVKSGLLPYGKIGEMTIDSPTLFRNDINRHISQIVTTRVATLGSPWLHGFKAGELHQVAASHGEGKFTCSPEMAQQLAKDGQIAFQYTDLEGNPTMESPFNPNGSTLAIEGIISPDGKILGKMGHSERFGEGLMQNIPGNKNQNIFANAINYFRK
ncbi:MAG: phosphoribosylformylglycinamidine synthase subunit PurQ, partial [Muribaculaceae bacterium]|nr:phosphoribosylformylglycinamidine synthase subunit PurQ [Muribaculaceae bacterium]